MEAYACETDFGNPSGHSETVVAMSLILVLDFCKVHNPPSSVKLMAIIFAGILSWSIAYSRLFLGVHSLNQVFFGGLLGAWVALTMHYCGCKEFCTDIAQELITG